MFDYTLKLSNFLTNCALKSDSCYMIGVNRIETKELIIERHLFNNET
jgi:hypothetical protein